tara:strand:+ start:127 stop:390 length:264 start_codon:yes stop_codon:yes gene_type:complete
MSHAIHKDDINRWFLVYDNDPGELGFVLFGYVGAIDVNELETGQPNILSYLTEDELEIYLDSVAGADYYKNAVESNSEKFQGPSQKY